MQPSLLIAGTEIPAGSQMTLELPLPFLYTHLPTTLPVHVIHGRNAGPCLLITSAIHGDEINGIEIIRRLMGHKSLSRIKGTLILIPVVNVFGFMNQSRYLPDRRDLNRSFPGSPTGSMAARLADLIMTDILPLCTHVIDLHTGAIGRENLPQIRATLETGSEELKEMALAFSAPVVLDASLRPGTFRQAAHALGISSLVYEAGEALRFNEVSIRAGVTGILNVMGYLNITRRRTLKRAHNPIIAKGSSWVRASQSGVIRSLIPLGARVRANETLAYISDTFGGNEEELISPVSGIVIGRTKLPLVHEGEAIFHIAKFSQTSEAAESVESFQDEFDPLTGTSDSDEPPVVG
jgi:predicted deacylase